MRFNSKKKKNPYFKRILNKRILKIMTQSNHSRSSSTQSSGRTPAITKAVFPVAGLGTRFLPATKANPKEMLAIVDKPLIQYAAEEAIAAGITELIFVTSSSKRAIEDHFDSNYELEAKLMQADKQSLLAIVRNVLPKGVNCVYVRQPDALGLGHAVLCAKPIVGQEPFAVLLADDLIDGDPRGCLEQMIAVYYERKGSVVAVEQVPPSEVSNYGIVALASTSGRIGEIASMVEKPPVGQAPSNLGVVGRYVLDPAIFSCLETTNPGRGGEIQLTDALVSLLALQPVYAYEFKGKRYDCGSKMGYLEATVAYALKHPEVGEAFKNHLETLAST
jgi:UTP--glucose-1-phosphate uridylyltransferase